MKQRWWSCSSKRTASLFSKSKFLARAHLPAAAIPHQGQHHCVTCPRPSRSLHICNIHTLPYLRSHTPLTRWFSEEAREVLCGNRRESWPFMDCKEKAGLTLNKKILITRNPKSQSHVNQKSNMGIWNVVTHESFQKYICGTSQLCPLGIKISIYWYLYAYSFPW